MAACIESTNQRIGQRTIAERLRGKIFIDPQSNCWNWTGSKDSHGYGQINIRGLTRLCHRISYEIHIGKIKDQLHVLHKCDNRACVNPDHLFLGTNSDNVADKIAKGRQPRRPNIANRGSSNGWAKLSEKDVVSIQSSCDLQKNLAIRYGVSVAQISRIKSGKRWHWKVIRTS
jgi:hypothetical protein